jgi:predicted dehydrogenase
MKKLNIGLIGAGARGETFARQLHQGTPRAQLFGVCDIDADRLNKFCDFCSLTGTPKFTDTDAFLAQKDLDAVIVTVPEFAHKEVCIKAMRQGKHIYVEKPLAHTYQDCVQIVQTQRDTGALVYVGFNMRANPRYEKMRQIVASGVLGTIIQASGAEVLRVDHGASFMRRFHRKSANSGGLLNHKCCHDIDILLWIIGHPKVTRIASFGSSRIFTPDKQPATNCSICPADIKSNCAYQAKPGFVFPVHHNQVIYHQDATTYGGDICVYTPDKDLVDNQVVIMEFENGIRGDFTLQMFHPTGQRKTLIRGEHGILDYDDSRNPALKLTLFNGDTSTYDFAPRSGGHGGTDPQMIQRFVEAIDNNSAGQSGPAQGLAAAIVAFTADQSRLTGKIIDVPASTYL